MEVLVVGSGGRETALGEQLQRSRQVTKLYFMPGNAGTSAFGENVAINPLDLTAAVEFITDRGIQLVVIGPEAPLVAGLSDAVRGAGVTVFGPSQKAAGLEGSKAFASAFMQRHSIPQPKSQLVHNIEEALAAIKDKPASSYVLKADGLAGGKGVILPESAAEAEAALNMLFAGGFDGAGKQGVVIQERLHGPEVSAFAISDGTNFVVLPNAQDHKRLQDHDQGPNTGGVGAYAPVPESIVSPAQNEKIRAIIKTTIDGMRAEGTPYEGTLYVGLMLAEERGGDPVVIEYNCRFGDPEAEVQFTALSASGCQTGDLLIEAAKGNLTAVALPEIKYTVLSVCLSAAGYPEQPRKGDAISGLDKMYDNVVVHQAATVKDAGGLKTSGGRVLYVTATGATPDEAAARAYAAIGPNAIHFDGMQYRTDIGWQARAK
ncbi:MAG TPA: phosphoribosylamine--glycine ligase [Patescibacteria group bacterium]|nr:phosphoribosylamine--glycine ligase [Patescibacteria group bacterium]